MRRWGSESALCSRGEAWRYALYIGADRVWHGGTASGIAAQAEAIFAQIHTIAAEEGITLQSLIKVTIFITSFDEIDALRKVLFHHFGDHLPASSLVEVSRLFSPDLHIEIEATLAL